MDSSTRQLILKRAGVRCEYRLLYEEPSGLAHHIEHITAKQHGGSDDAQNLALACNRCNACKAPNLTGIDLWSSQIVTLFHPRCDAWKEHFEFQGARIVGKMPQGRVTIHVLPMNDQRH